MTERSTAGWTSTPGRSPSDRGVEFVVGPVRLRPARLIYGTIVLVALLGLLGQSPRTASGDALAVILGASLALYLAHCYSESVGAHLEFGNLTGRRAAHILREELSVVAPATLPVGLLLCARLSLMETETALRLSIWGGIGVLALAGWALGEGGRLGILGRLGSAALSAALGTCIVLLEVTFAH